MTRDLSLEPNKVQLESGDYTKLLTQSVISQGSMSDCKETQHFGIRTYPHKKFVWNLHLLNEGTHHVHITSYVLDRRLLYVELKADLHPNWILFITHGFISQSNINVFGRPLYLTLIARRYNSSYVIAVIWPVISMLNCLSYRYFQI